MARKRKYECNDEFFSVLNEKSTYWLGFLYADGYVAKDRNRISLSLSAKDSNHVLKFKEHIKSTAPIIQEYSAYSKEYKKTLKTKLVISSEKIKIDLVNNGCSPKKSLTCTFPSLPKNMIPHFIRGYFDGDGSVYITKPYKTRKYPMLSVSIIGTLEFMTEIKKLLHFDEKKTLQQDKRLAETTNIRILRFTGLHICKSFYDYIYKDATVYLERKREKFEEYFKQGCSETTISPSLKEKKV